MTTRSVVSLALGLAVSALLGLSLQHLTAGLGSATRVLGLGVSLAASALIGMAVVVGPTPARGVLRIRASRLAPSLRHLTEEVREALDVDRDDERPALGDVLSEVVRRGVWNRDDRVHFEHALRVRNAVVNDDRPQPSNADIRTALHTVAMLRDKLRHRFGSAQHLETVLRDWRRPHRGVTSGLALPGWDFSDRT